MKDQVQDETADAYEPPAIEWEEQIEVAHLQAACAHTPGLNMACNNNPLS